MMFPPTAIPYAPPDRFVPGLVKGTFKLVGATIRDENNVVRGHVVQVASKTIGGAPLGPVGAALQLASSAAENAQLVHLQKTVDNLKLIATVGTVASVANVGISVVGFAAVMRRLGAIDAKLDHVLAAIDALRMIVEQMSHKLDVFTLARLRSIGQLLSIAEAALDEVVRRDHLLRAAAGFAELRSHYALLLRASPLSHFDMPPRAALELYARFTAAARGELKARLLLGDVPAYRRAAEQVAEDARSVMSLRASTVYEARHSGAASRGPATVMEYCGADLEGRVRAACADLHLTRDLLEGEVLVADYLEQNDLSPRRYVEALSEFEEAEAIVLPIKP